MANTNLPAVITEEDQVRAQRQLNRHRSDVINEMRQARINRFRQNRQQVEACSTRVLAFAYSTCTSGYSPNIACASAAYFEASVCHMPNAHQYAYNMHPNNPGEYLQSHEEKIKKQVEAKKKAKELMISLLGVGQAAIYAKTMRIILKPNRHFWVIGDLWHSYREKTPFYGKPDVIRVDNPKKNHVTSFCVDQRGGPSTPYTDKVYAFSMHLQANEKAFVKTINRIREHSLEDMPECAKLGI